MPFNISSVSNTSMSYLSGSFRNLFDSRQYNPPIVFDESLHFEVRGLKFVLGIQKLLSQDTQESGSGLSQPLVQLLEQITVKASVDIKKAMKKNSGYLSRLFSAESWVEWTDDKTALGNVISAYLDYLSSKTRLDIFLKHFDISIVQKANQEAFNCLNAAPFPSVKAFPPSHNLWTRVGNIFSSIDKKISSLILPRGASAEKTNPNSNKNNPDESESSEDQEYTRKASQLSYYGNLQPSQVSQAIKIEEEKIDLGRKQLIENKKFRLEEVRSRRLKDAEKLLRSYEKSYRAQHADYQADKVNYPTSDGHYFDKNKNVGPIVCENLLVEGANEGEDSEPECVYSFTVTPGHLRWSIFKEKSFRSDTLVAEGSFNYDTENDKPSYPVCSNKIAPQCRS